MSLVPYDSWFNFDKTFDDFFPARSRLTATEFSPKVDIIDKDGYYEIHADLPGVNKDDIKVELHNGILTLQASTHKEDKEEKDGKVIRQERFNGEYRRSFTLGPDVHEHDISAKFADGVLTLTAPKVPEQKPTAKTIHIE